MPREFALSQRTNHLRQASVLRTLTERVDALPDGINLGDVGWLAPAKHANPFPARGQRGTKVLHQLTYPAPGAQSLTKF